MKIGWIGSAAAGIALLLSILSLASQYGEDRGTVVLRLVAMEGVDADHEERIRGLEAQGGVIEGLVVEVRAARRDIERIRNILEAQQP